LNVHISIQKEIFALPKQGESAMHRQQHEKCTGDSTSVSMLLS